MKARTLKTSKILAAVITTAAAAGAASSAEAAAGAHAASIADDAKLHPLRAELLREGREKALARIAHFRPLCDADGYPLVGNLNRKGSSSDFQPSAFCAEVRKRGSK
jgi:hypothetical protein